MPLKTGNWTHLCPDLPRQSFPKSLIYCFNVAAVCVLLITFSAVYVFLWLRLLIWRLFLFCNTFKHLNRVDTHKCTHLTSLTTCARPIFSHTSNVYHIFPSSPLIISLWTNWTEERQPCSFVTLLHLMKTQNEILDDALDILFISL